MNRRTTRLPLPTDAELNEEQEALLTPLRISGNVYAVSRAWVRHPRSLRAFNGFAGHVFDPERSTLALRDREILVLRTAWRCRSSYEWGRHIVIGRDAGLSDGEMELLKRNVAAGDWTDHDAILIETADALLSEFFIPDGLWTKLAAEFDERQRIDAILTVGMYAMMGMFLNAAEVPLDPGFPLDPDFNLAP